jgi:hypothetical protein
MASKRAISRKPKLTEANKNGTIVVSSPFTDLQGSGKRFDRHPLRLACLDQLPTKKNAPYTELHLLNLYIVQEGSLG